MMNGSSENNADKLENVVRGELGLVKVEERPMHFTVGSY
jgi:hypothetical protein